MDYHPGLWTTKNSICHSKTRLWAKFFTIYSSHVKSHVHELYIQESTQIDHQSETVQIEYTQSNFTCIFFLSKRIEPKAWLIQSSFLLSAYTMYPTYIMYLSNPEVGNIEGNLQINSPLVTCLQDSFHNQRAICN